MVVNGRRLFICVDQKEITNPCIFIANFFYKRKSILNRGVECQLTTIEIVEEGNGTKNTKSR